MGDEIIYVKLGKFENDEYDKVVKYEMNKCVVVNEYVNVIVCSNQTLGILILCIIYNNT